MENPVSPPLTVATSPSFHNPGDASKPLNSNGNPDAFRVAWNLLEALG